MKKFKYIFLPFFAVIFIFCFSIVSFGALDYEYTLKELLTINNATVFGQVIDSNGSTVYSSVAWSGNNQLNVTPSVTGVNAFGVVVGNSNADTPILSLERNEVLYFHSDSMVYLFQASGDDIPSQGFFNFKIEISFLKNDGFTEDVLVYSVDSADDVYRSGTVILSYFRDVDFLFALPADYTDIMIIRFTCESDRQGYLNAGVSFNSSPITFYLGDRAGAPIYSGVDDSNQNDLDSKEQVIRDTTDQGFTEWNSTFDLFKSTLGYTSDFMLGASWITNNILNPFLNRTPLGSFLLLSLVFGIFIFLLGSAGFILSKITSNRRYDAMVSWRERRRYRK